MKKVLLFSLTVCLVLIASKVFAQDSLFSPPVNYGIGSNPTFIYSTDLDGDSDYDLVANGFADNVSILLNNGDGTFQPMVNYGTGDSPISVYSADLDGDSDNDLAVANRDSDDVSILLNNGNGTFQVAVNYGTGMSPFSVFSTDLDGDSDYDLAVANNSSNNVSILLNNGDGTFQAAANYGAGNWPYSVYSADLDGDNDNDLAVANYYADYISILLNNGNGTFTSAVNYGTGDTPISIYSADLDGDNDNDLATANRDTDNVSILLNNGNGTFASAVNYGAGDSPFSVYSADFDDDSDIDLSVANKYTDNVSILLNNGNGTFQSADNYGAGDGPQSVFSADLDGDSDIDLAVTNNNSNNISILFNLTTIDSCLNCSATTSTPRVPNINGTIMWDLDVTNCSISPLNVYAEIYPTVGDCASGTQYDFNINRLVVSNLASGDSATLYYWYRPGTVNGVIDAAINIDVGPSIGNYVGSCCFEFIFAYEFGRQGNDIDFGPGEWGERGFDEILPTTTALNQNYPNPFNASTTVSFEIAHTGDVNLSIYNLMGQKVETLVEGNLNAGYYNITWNASEYSSGIYFYKLTTNTKTLTKRMTLLK
ncbi:MAG: T9SS type A sorting domain-containing protein [candidate division Zixibacteria bacterium]|nr:T9SS type A sorting domain-containing protein [candidate division Zixibacteria bacterium]